MSNLSYIGGPLGGQVLYMGTPDSQLTHYAAAFSLLLFCAAKCQI